MPGAFNSIADLTSGPGGNLWFIELEGGPTAGEHLAVGEIIPTGATKLFALPQAITLDPSLGVPADPTVITTGPDGALWFGETGAIGRITTAGTVQQFPLPIPSATVGDITSGPDGSVWFAEAINQPNGSADVYSIGRITGTGTITMYPQSNSDISSAYLTEGPKGTLWFTENPDAIGQVTPQGQIKTFSLPKKLENDGTLGNITQGPGGNLWFPIQYSHKDGRTTGAIGRITAKGRLKVYNVSSVSYPSDIISGPDGKLWFDGGGWPWTGIARISTSGKLGAPSPLMTSTTWSLCRMARSGSKATRGTESRHWGLPLLRASSRLKICLHQTPPFPATIPKRAGAD